MKRADFLVALRAALSAIREPRYFQTERGYQGALLTELQSRLTNLRFPNQRPIIEQEYQKVQSVHRTKIRPDIIVHIPFERATFRRRNQGNFVAIEIKRRANSSRAKKDFKSLLRMKRQLRYPLTVFINVDSSVTHDDLCPDLIASQTYCFAVKLNGPVPVIVEKKCRKRRTNTAS